MPSDPWTPVCRIGDLTPLRGVPGLVGGEPVALVLVDGRVHAVGDVDPATGNSNLHRGMVAQRGNASVLLAPDGGHAYDLETGRDLREPALGVPVHDVQLAAAVVEVRLCRAPVHERLAA